MILSVKSLVGTTWSPRDLRAKERVAGLATSRARRGHKSEGKEPAASKIKQQKVPGPRLTGLPAVSFSNKTGGVRLAMGWGGMGWVGA